MVRFISITTPAIEIDGDRLSPEGLIAYCARVSSPHQENPDYAKLLRYCIRKGHWSVFEMVDMTVEITTSRAITAQLLRHKSFQNQEFSLRYSEAMDYEPCNARRQDDKNRQNSIDDLDDDVKEAFENAQAMIWNTCYQSYQHALAQGIAKECARMLLPLNTQTKLYMKGSVRSWIHYLQVRCGPETQKEHRDIAEGIKLIFNEKFPTVAEALEWN
ncbi:FAD-dependent thymidylate synthase [Synechocystis sp. FACHB-383]|uniref:FAD-dependent thymidylate synthase n=1 Tax=Synechocystis sp. FACHB-383 TaxID=2692864 RepID=UPI0016889A9C|nr:FAD-dependent thymidylate synthase [Synechocystis sp. FACHB-383]MBD2653135.1 FAD-dependent thymidylate synthase [Synechocystis sp. FACHB-383]